MNRRTLIAMLLCVGSLSSCKDIGTARGLATAAIADFHQQFNDGKYRELYSAGHASLKKAATEADFLKLLEAVHHKLGKQVSSTETGWRVNTFNMKTTALVTQDTKFEHGQGTETFTYVISYGKCELEGYHINSNDMMTKE